MATRIIYIVDCRPYFYLGDIIREHSLPGLYSYLDRVGWGMGEVDYRGVKIIRHEVRTK